MSVTDNVTMLQVPVGLGAALLAWVGQQVTVYLTHVSAESVEGVPMPQPGCAPCPPYQQPPTLVPGAGGPNITGGTPIVPGISPGNVGPITGSPIGSAALWGCPPEPVAPMGETAAVAGTLAFVGLDYIIIRVPTAAGCVDLLIPINAIGSVVIGCMV